MKKVVNLLKKAVKWYFNLAAQSYMWTPTGIVPYVRE